MTNHTPLHHEESDAARLVELVLSESTHAVGRVQ
jgi:hypothetical protein